MAKVWGNPILKGISGKLGDWFVVRRGKGGSTIVSLFSEEPTERTYSDSELAQQEAFKQAAEYAKTAMNQPLYQQLAKGTPKTSYNVAVADWFGKPEIVDIDANGWTGQAGQTIRIKAIDDTKVVRVRVVIHNNGTVLEEGEAVSSETNGLLWTYVTTTEVTPAPGILLDANAYDLADNLGASSVSMS